MLTQPGTYCCMLLISILEAMHDLRLGCFLQPIRHDAGTAMLCL